jgi:polyhydroxyalkanoate synthase
MTSIVGSHALKNGLLNWTPTLKAEADRVPVPEIEAELRRRIGLMLQGIETYRAHAYRRSIPDPGHIWCEGTSRLLDYRPFLRGKGAKRPVVLVPSLVNRAYILDLSERRSLARWLSRQGHPVFMMDWQAPAQTEQDFCLNDYIARLRRAIRFVATETGTAVAVIGYCMGGVLSLAACRDIQDHVDAQIFMATPWDFHAERPDQSRALASLLPALEPSLHQNGCLHVDVLQSLFAALDPMLVVRKFAAFAEKDPDSEAAIDFVALEDWINDGVPLSAGVVRDCFSRWYGTNDPARGEWRVDGLPVDPAKWQKPALCVIPDGDRIVPPKSALALANALPQGRRITPATGHIGMVTARRAETLVWAPIAAFLDASRGDQSRQEID